MELRLAGGACALQPAKSVCPGPRRRTGHAATRPTATASRSDSSSHWTKRVERFELGDSEQLMNNTLHGFTKLVVTVH